MGEEGPQAWTCGGNRGQSNLAEADSPAARAGLRSRDLVHAESQLTTAAGSPTGRRYRHHASLGSDNCGPGHIASSSAGLYGTGLSLRGSDLAQMPALLLPDPPEVPGPSPLAQITPNQSRSLSSSHLLMLWLL